LTLSALAAEASAARPLAAGSQALSRAAPPPARSEAPPHPFIVALVETWAPPDDGLERDERDAVLTATARFVEAELAELPARLAWLHATALFGFRVITAVVHLRTFCALDVARRRRWVERWAFGRFALGRQLFRATRSTALVAYYEHPLVLEKLGVPRAPRALATGEPASNVVALRAGGARRG
jgi:hypothetical protein